MLRQSINVFPFTLLVILIFLLMPETTRGLLSNTEKPIERSAMLEKKILEQQQLKQLGGKDKNCQVYGPGYRLNQDNVAGLVAFLAEIDRQR